MKLTRNQDVRSFVRERSDSLDGRMVWKPYFLRLLHIVAFTRIYVKTLSSLVKNIWLMAAILLNSG